MSAQPTAGAGLSRPHATGTGAAGGQCPACPVPSLRVGSRQRVQISTRLHGLPGTLKYRIVYGFTVYGKRRGHRHTTAPEHAVLYCVHMYAPKGCPNEVWLPKGKAWRNTATTHAGVIRIVCGFKPIHSRFTRRRRLQPAAARAAPPELRPDLVAARAPTCVHTHAQLVHMHMTC